MLNNQNIFNQKKILIYGLGKSGLSTFKFLKKKNETYLFDDWKVNDKNKVLKKNLVNYQELLKKNIDHIIISPGIDINRCSLRKYLKKNYKKINTDLDIFYNFYNKNKKITITGTNGKSTTARILYEVLRDQNFDARIVGNIGNPVLLEKNITNKTIFVVEASSYQLEYSKLFRADISVILNISPDHLERHKTLKNYIEAKFKIVKNQTKKDYTILNMNNLYIKKQVKLQKFLPKLIKIYKYQDIKFLNNINNPYFYSQGNTENLSFVIEIAKILKINNNSLFETLKKFKGLQYRQQIIFRSKNLTIINDSKSTSFSSSASILKLMSNVFWIVGGLAKKGDKLLLKKDDCKNLKAYIYGKNKNTFISELKNIAKYESFTNLKSLIKKVFLDIKNNKNQKHRTILFSPAAASFDSFKNFEERGKYFNNLIKKNNNV
jgi:UDP-N-acetylmuramoylalanine--D-glutamate ligase